MWKKKKAQLRTKFQPQWIPASQQKKEKGQTQQNCSAAGTWNWNNAARNVHIFIPHNNMPAKATALAQNSHIERQQHLHWTTKRHHRFNRSHKSPGVSCYCKEVRGSPHDNNIITIWDIRWREANQRAYSGFNLNNNRNRWYTSSRLCQTVFRSGIRSSAGGAQFISR